MEREQRSRSRDRGFGEEIPKTKRLFIGGINGSITKEVIQDNFGGYGNIVDLFVKVRPDNSAFGIIEYATQEEADAAIRGLNRTNIGQCRVFVNYSKPRNNNGGGRGTSSSAQREMGGGRGSFQPNRDFNRNTRPQGGQRPRGCFNCQSPSHMSRQCPKPRNNDRGGDRPRGCFNCQSPSHMSRECPKGEICHDEGRNGDRGSMKEMPRPAREEMPRRENNFGSKRNLQPPANNGADQDEY